MWAYGRYVDKLHRRLVPYPHWYLEIIGVAPAHQGQGFSSRLLRPVLERIDRERMPCYLETNAEKNVAIYRRFGFEVVSEDKMPGTEVTTFAMLLRRIHDEVPQLQRLRFVTNFPRDFGDDILDLGAGVGVGRDDQILENFLLVRLH